MMMYRDAVVRIVILIFPSPAHSTPTQPPHPLTPTHRHSVTSHATHKTHTSVARLKALFDERRFTVRSLVVGRKPPLQLTDEQKSATQQVRLRVRLRLRVRW